MEERTAPGKKAPPAIPPPGQLSDAKPPVDPASLSPEEQMEKYEEDLKENDWGHQPC